MGDSTERVAVTIDGRVYHVAPGTSVAVALWNALGPGFRRSGSGEPRGPLCGMGICFECRATVDDRPQRATCQIPCRDGLVIRTDSGMEP